jgi:predicted DCC family thiol-disulfide oxidoreductase YuxK
VPRLTVLYDADCRVCTRVAGRLAGLDRGRRLRLVPLQRATADRPEVVALAGSVDLGSSLHVVAPDGQWWRGGEAVIQVLDCLAPLRPFARLARTPVLSPLVEPAYRAVARHRGRLTWLAGDFQARHTGDHQRSLIRARPV